MYPSPVPPPRTPGQVVALRVLAWVQVGVGLLGVAIGAVFIVALSTATDSTDDFTRDFAQLGLVAAVIVVGISLIVLLSIALPAFFLRTGRRSRKTGALFTLVAVEIVFAVLQLGGTIAGLVDGVRSIGSLFPLVLAAVPVTMVVLALHPASRAWAAVDPRTPAATHGPWSPYGPPTTPPYGSPAAPPYGPPPGPPPTW